MTIKNRTQFKGIAVDAKSVQVDGQVMSYHEWCKLATGWSSVQTYAVIIHVEKQATLSTLRQVKMEELAVEELDKEGA